jgi:hypothetical protein
MFVAEQLIKRSNQSISYMEVKGKEGWAGSQTYMFAAEQLIKHSNQSISYLEVRGKEGWAGSQTYMFAAEQLIKHSNLSISYLKVRGKYGLVASCHQICHTLDGCAVGTGCRGTKYNQTAIDQSPT